MTRNAEKSVIFFGGIVLVLVLSSCSWLRKEQKPVGNVQGEKQTEYIKKQVQTEIDDGNFQRAIDLWKEIYQKYPQDSAVRSGYIRTLESMKGRGDLAFETRDFSLADKIYGVLAGNWAFFSDFSQSISFRKDFLEKRIETSRCLFTEEQVSSHLRTGGFRKAIDLCKEMYDKYPQDPRARSHYIRTLESIKARGDQAFEGSDFALAGSVYEIVLKALSLTRRLNGSLSFSREGLTAKIGNCKKILFENGLEQYRSGNLNQAISLWKSILAFDPENREIKRAVEMATFQFSNLQKTK